MISLYLKILRLRSFIKITTQRVIPQRVQLLMADEHGDLTTTISWLLGIAVIAGVGVAIYTNIIAPNLAQATTKSSGLVNSIP